MTDMEHIINEAMHDFGTHCQAGSKSNVTDKIISDLFTAVYLQISNISKWYSVGGEPPYCYETGDWDGKRSDFILIKDGEGEVNVGVAYSGFVDGVHFINFYDRSGLEIEGHIVSWQTIPK